MCSLWGLELGFGENGVEFKAQISLERPQGLELEQYVP